MSKNNSNTCGLICVPLKRAADIDVSKPLGSVIKSNYSTSVNFKVGIRKMSGKCIIVIDNFF